jgi:glycine cleavage system H protein
MSTPKELKYSKDHEWVKIEGKIATIGITDFAQKQLGDVVFVDLPEEEGALTAGQEFCAIESVKAVSDVYAPVSGTIKEVNVNLVDAPELINQDAYGDGWIAKVEISSESDLEKLLDNVAYDALCAEEEH